MMTVHRAEQGLVAMLKGAPDEVMTMCSRVDRDSTVADLDEATLNRFADHNAEMATRAMRVLALAHRQLPAEYTEADLQSGFTLSGSDRAGRSDPAWPFQPRSGRCIGPASARS